MTKKRVEKDATSSSNGRMAKKRNLKIPKIMVGKNENFKGPRQAGKDVSPEITYGPVGSRGLEAKPPTVYTFNQDEFFQTCKNKAIPAQNSDGPIVSSKNQNESD